MEIRIANEEDKQAVFNLRLEVFVGEQNVPPEIELDCEDDSATHIIAYQDGAAVGCGRIVISGSAAHIGRIAVKKTCRNTGIGSAVCRFIIDHCADCGCKNIWLNSQLHASGFYKKLGFTPNGEIFTEAGIEHIRMELSIDK